MFEPNNFGGVGKKKVTGPPGDGGVSLEMGPPRNWSWRLGISIKCSAAARSARLRCISIGRVMCIRVGELVGAGHRVVSCAGCYCGGDAGDAGGAFVLV